MAAMSTEQAAALLCEGGGGARTHIRATKVRLYSDITPYKMHHFSTDSDGIHRKKTNNTKKINF